MWDTVLLVGMVTRWPWEIDDNEGGIVGFLNDELVQLDRGVHSTKIIVMSARMRERSKLTLLAMEGKQGHRSVTVFSDKLPITMTSYICQSEVHISPAYGSEVRPSATSADLEWFPSKKLS